MPVYCMYNIRPEVNPAQWERFLVDEDIPFTLEFPSIVGYRIFRNGGDPESTLAFQYLEVLDVSNLEAFRADTRSDRWAQGMEAWYRAGGASWYMFYPEEVGKAPGDAGGSVEAS